MTTYTSLPNLSALVGVFKFNLYSEFAGLTVPTIQTVIEIGESVESADMDVGVSEVSTLTIKLREDYSTYSYGFWFKVLSGETWLRIYLNQDGSDLFYFFGTVQANTVQWQEEYIGSTRIRTVTFDLVSMASKIMETPTTTWVDAVVVNQVATGAAISGQPTQVMSARGLFAAMLSASAMNPSYALTDVSFVWNAGPDFIYTIGAAEYDLDDLYVTTKRKGTPDTTDPYFAHVSILPNKSRMEDYYVKLGAMLGDLLKNLGVVMRMSYNTSTERHLIQLIQRGRAYSATLDFESREKSSTIRKSFDLLGDATRCTDLVTTSQFCWFSKKYSDAPTTSTPPDYVDFDSDSRCIWGIDSTTATLGWLIWDGVSGHAVENITGIKYFNYDTDLPVTASASNALMQEAIAGYIYHRFTNEYASFIRRYSKFFAAAGSDHTSLSILRRTTINDGLTSNVYYANKVKKIPSASEFEIEWILE